MVVFWEFGEGFKEDDGYDRVCFPEIKNKLNCVDKNSLMMVVQSKRQGLSFRMDSGIYFIKKDGSMIKKKYE